MAAAGNLVAGVRGTLVIVVAIKGRDGFADSDDTYLRAVADVSVQARNAV